MSRQAGGPMPRAVVGTVILAVAVVALFLFSLSVGEVPIPVPEVIAVLSGQDLPLGFFVTEFRLPRAAAAVVVGCGLGAAGAITQSLLRNPLASPDIIGVTAGASTAAVAVLATGTAVAPALAAWSLPLAAAVGGLIAGGLVVALSWHGGIAVRRVVLVGLGVDAGLAALTSALLVSADLPGLNKALHWLTGSLNNVDVATLGPVTWISVLGLLCAALASRPLGMLRFDEATATALGVRVRLNRVVLFSIAIVLASAVTALAGTVGFVAFVAPQAAMVLLRTEGPPPIGGALMGAMIMLASDLVAANAFPVDLPVGLITSFVGAPFLLWVLVRGSGAGHAGQGAI